MDAMRYLVQEVVAFIAACSLMVALAKVLSLTSTVDPMATSETTAVDDVAQALKSKVPVENRENQPRRARMAR